jgi:hypothetical protein
MKQSTSRQLQLVFLADESRIWESLETAHQQQLTEHLARVCVQYAMQARVMPSTVVCSSTESDIQEQSS